MKDEIVKCKEEREDALLPKKSWFGFEASLNGDHRKYSSREVHRDSTTASRAHERKTVGLCEMGEVVSFVLCMIYYLLSAVLVPTRRSLPGDESFR